MKQRKNLLLSTKAVARGERIAAETGKSLSAVIEEQLLSIPDHQSKAEEFWSGRGLKPIHRQRDPRYEYLKHKHG